METIYGSDGIWLSCRLVKSFIFCVGKAFILALWSLGFILFCDFAIDGGIPLCCESLFGNFIYQACCIYESQFLTITITVLDIDVIEHGIIRPGAAPPSNSLSGLTLGLFLAFIFKLILECFDAE
jgi:hypothetical protein